MITENLYAECESHHTLPPEKGDKGDKGDTGATGGVGPRGPQGRTGGEGVQGVGVPAGGNPLQVLRKDSVGGGTEWVTPDKALVGLPNVDNTADANKPLSNAAISALDNKAAKGDLFISVKDYGAIGDGVADDTAAINTAKTMATGRTLYFPAGTYICSTLSIDNDIDFMGEIGTTIKQKSATNNFFISITQPNIRFRVFNLTIDQNNAGQTTGLGKFLFNTTQAGATAEFRAVTFRNFCEGALRIVGDRVASTRETMRVFNCKFRGGTESTSGSYNTFTIFAADASELTVCDSDFDHRLAIVAQGIPAITVAATVVDSPDYTELTVRNCRFQGYGRFTVGSGIGVIDSYAWATNMEITGNKFIESRVTPIRGKVNARDGVISGNIMTNFISSGAGFGNGISLVSATVAPVGGNFEIASNVIHGAPGNGIDVSHSTGTVQNINIHDNIIDNAGATGISIIRAENFNIHDNIIKMSGAQAITMNSCAGKGKIGSNTIAGSTLAGIQTIGDQLTLDLHVIGNFVEASTASGITIENVRHLSLQGNTVKDVIDGGASGQRGYRIGGTTGIAVGQIKNNTAIGTFTTGIYTIISAGILTAFEEGNSWNFQKGQANAIPTAGTWMRGSIIWNTTPVASGTIGWICVVAGTPGTWKTFGAIGA